MKKFKNKITSIIAFTFLTLMTIIWVVPLLWSLLSALKSETEIQTIGYKLLPVKWTLENFSEVITDTVSAPLVKWFLNSLFISGAHTILMVAIASMAAYAYARLTFKGKNTIFWILMGTMMFPSVINMIPLYKIMDTLGWINSPLAVIVPGLGTVFSIYLIRQFMQDIPKELDEAARIDGANEWQIYTKIILPLSKPVLTVVALFSFTGSWNDFLWPSLVFNDIDKMPITPGLQLLQGVYDIEIAHLMASAMISIIPTFVLYLFAQKYFLEGLSLSSGTKG